MPDAATQRTTALATLRLYAQPDIPPIIEPEALDEILNGSAKATIWAVATAYEFGDIVLPTVRNGHRYKCTVAGTSEADADDEPEWGVGAGSILTEGDSDPVLTWMEDGPDFKNLYNVRAAIHAAWMYKAGQASQLYATSQSGSRFEHQQIYDHCIQMAEKFAPVEVA